MTELRGKVEPPITKLSVQRTIGSLAFAVILWQATVLTRLCMSPAVPDLQQPARTDRPAPSDQGLSDQGLSERGLSERGLTLIQIDLNRADTRELSLLPRIGPVLARRIVEHRERFGPFESVGSLGEVPGIGTRTIEEIGRLGYVEPATVGDQRERTNSSDSSPTLR